MTAKSHPRGFRSNPVRVTMPSWVFGGDPAGLGAFCNWILSRETAQSNVWLVQQAEAVHGDLPKLLILNSLATSKNAGSESSYSHVRRLADNDLYMTNDYWPAVIKNDEAMTNRFPGDLVALIKSIAVLTLAVPSAAKLPGCFSR